MNDRADRTLARVGLTLGLGRCFDGRGRSPNVLSNSRPIVRPGRPGVAPPASSFRQNGRDGFVGATIRTRRGLTSPSGFDPATREIDAVISTGAAVRRRDWGEYDEVLDMRPKAVRLLTGLVPSFGVQVGGLAPRLAADRRDFPARSCALIFARVLCSKTEFRDRN